MGKSSCVIRSFETQKKPYVLNWQKITSIGYCNHLRVKTNYLQSKPFKEVKEKLLISFDHKMDNFCSLSIRGPTRLVQKIQQIISANFTKYIYIYRNTHELLFNKRFLFNIIKNKFKGRRIYVSIYYKKIHCIRVYIFFLFLAYALFYLK